MREVMRLQNHHGENPKLTIVPKNVGVGDNEDLDQMTPVTYIHVTLSM